MTRNQEIYTRDRVSYSILERTSMLLTDEKQANRVVLYNIGWEQFENLLKDLGNRCLFTGE